ncbi:uncharacterized protein CTRU02_206550 [Colletotrichum truncatum]|uniref:Uncharacterized protein n=1 Tax=Colletotrichum truncatum TaxID=5467 RepID=A0ACC3Z7A5_COLTU|nr:uncharacterized protein CTRU02_11920 [Colletotrichum truncatum]KAF6785295.1 hypothetical protein CTRU02_11920 [Colletotrichum truncatum]
MGLSPEQVAHLNRQARRRAERAAEEMSFNKVSSEDYLKRLRARRRPGRPFEIEDIPAAVEIEDETDIPPLKASHSPNPRRTPHPPRSTATPKGARGPSAPRTPSTSKVKETPSSKSTARISTKTSVSFRGWSRERSKSQHDLLQNIQRPSTTTLDSVGIKSTGISATSPSRSTTNVSKPNKSIRRVASVSAIPPKSDPSEKENTKPDYKPKHSRSQSSPTAIPPSDAPMPRGTLTKRSSIRALKDKIRRVASAFELRSTEDDSEPSNGITLQHNKSTRSLLRYSATRIRRRRLDTVNEEA